MYRNEDEKRISYIILFSIIGLSLIIAIGYLIFSDKTVNKIDSTKEYVYTTDTSSSNLSPEVSQLPVINLDTDEIVNINSTISNKYNEIIKTNGNSFTYGYSVTDDILSIIIKVSDLKNTYKINEVSFISYNINVKSGKIISDDEMLKKFSITKNDIESIIKSRFEKFYKEETEQGYIEAGECNYECYLNIRGVTSYIDDIHLFVQSGSLYVYKSFELRSIYEDESYFSSDPYSFIIKK